MQPNPYAPPRDHAASPLHFSGAASLSHFRSASFAGKMALAVMGLSVGSGLVNRFLELIVLSQGRSFAWIDAVQNGFRPMLVLIGLGAMATFCVWLHRAASNVVALGRPGLRSAPATCVIWFFVPLANLFMPFFVVSQIAAASSDREKAPVTVLMWWSNYLLSTLIVFVTALAHRSSSANVAWLMTSLSTFFHAIAFVALVFLIPKIDRDQDARFAEIQAATSTQ